MEFKDNVSWTKGSHFFKAGYHYRYHYVFFGLENRTNFNFSPDRYTLPDGASASDSFAFANFMLGNLSSSRAGREARLNHNFPGHYFYFQDSWQATPELPVQLDLRYELRMGWQDKRGFSTNLEPGCVEANPDNLLSQCYSPALATPLGSLTFPETGRFVTDQNIFNWTRNGWQPRLGLSYRLAENTVLRVGGGLYGNKPPAACCTAQQPLETPVRMQGTRTSWRMPSHPLSSCSIPSTPPLRWVDLRSPGEDTSLICPAAMSPIGALDPTTIGSEYDGRSRLRGHAFGTRDADLRVQRRPTGPRTAH